ncbi:MAG: NAD(P)/FAD-dependent oxidoreductase [Archangium sp.]
MHWQPFTMTTGEASAVFAPLQQDLEVEVAIVGATVAGLATALRLQRAGRSVVVLEPETILTAEARAHGVFSELLDTRYHELETRFGYCDASLAATSARRAIDLVESFANELGCEFQRVPAFLYASSEDQKAALTREYEALKRVGAAVSWVKTLPSSLHAVAAVRVERQGQLEPRAFAVALARRFVADGGLIFEKTGVLGIDDGEICFVRTPYATVRADDVVVCREETRSRRSDLVTSPLTDALPEGLYVDVNEGDVRARVHGKAVTVEAEGQSTQRLLCFGPSMFGASKVTSYASRELVRSVDGLPLIGRTAAARHVFTASSFGSQDLTLGMVAAMVLGDQVRGVSHVCTRLYSPARVPHHVHTGASNELVTPGSALMRELRREFLTEEKRRESAQERNRFVLERTRQLFTTGDDEGRDAIAH